MWQVFRGKDPRALLHHQPAENPITIGQTPRPQRQNRPKIRTVHQRLVSRQQLHLTQQSCHSKVEHPNIN